MRFEAANEALLASYRHELEVALEQAKGAIA
jgi:hypothetical protein